MTLFSFATKNIIRDSRNYIFYFVNCVFAVFVFFLFSVLSFHPSLKVIDQNSTMALILMVGEFISIAFSICFITYSVSCFLKTRSKQFGILTIIGASKKQLNKLIFIENILIGFSSILSGILLGLLLSKMFLIAAGHVIGMGDFSFYFPFKAMLLTTITLGMVFFGVAYFTPKMIRKKEIIKLIKTEVIGEKRQRLFVPTLLLFLSLPITIWIFTSKTSLAESLLNNQLFLIPLATTIMLCTYLLFAYGQRILGFLINHSKSKLKLLYMSDIQSKLKANSQSMTITTLLYTISFFAIIILFSMSTNVKLETEKIMPYAMTYNVWGEGTETLNDLETIEKNLTNIDGFKKIKFHFSYDKELFPRNVLIPLTEYNEIMLFLGRESISLEQGDAYLVSGNVNAPITFMPNDLENIFERNNLSLTFSGTSKETIMLSGFADTICVLNDVDFALLSQDLAKREIYAFHYNDWENNDRVVAQIRDDLKLTSESTDINVIFAYNYYSSSQLQNSLTLYIGGILCFTFILTVASLMYSRLYSSLESESVKYRNIVKIGLSRKELSAVLSKEVSLLLLTPFLIALLYLWIGLLIAEQSAIVSYIPIAIGSTTILVFTQIVLWVLIRSAYRKAIFNKVFDEL